MYAVRAQDASEIPAWSRLRRMDLPTPGGRHCIRISHPGNGALPGVYSQMYSTQKLDQTPAIDCFDAGAPLADFLYSVNLGAQQPQLRRQSGPAIMLPNGQVVGQLLGSCGAAEPRRLRHRRERRRRRRRHLLFRSRPSSLPAPAALRTATPTPPARGSSRSRSSGRRQQRHRFRQGHGVQRRARRVRRIGLLLLVLQLRPTSRWASTPAEAPARRGSTAPPGLRSAGSTSQQYLVRVTNMDTWRTPFNPPAHDRRGHQRVHLSVGKLRSLAPCLVPNARAVG